jgi:hypothetical protein
LGYVNIPPTNPIAELTFSAMYRVDTLPVAVVAVTSVPVAVVKSLLLVVVVVVHSVPLVVEFTIVSVASDCVV